MDTEYISSDFYLVVRVTMFEPRYYGTPEWPPSPARLFQALVAGSAGSHRGLDELGRETLEFLETLEAPIIVAPRSKSLQRVPYYVPHNDLDTERSGPKIPGNLRVEKVSQARQLIESSSFLYAWPLSGKESRPAYVEKLKAHAKSLYQFGQGFDMAYSQATLRSKSELAKDVTQHSGDLFVPTQQFSENRLQAPKAGTLASLLRNHEARKDRFGVVEFEGAHQRVYREPPPKQFTDCDYVRGLQRIMVDLIHDPAVSVSSTTIPGRRPTWPTQHGYALAAQIRQQLEALLVDDKQKVSESQASLAAHFFDRLRCIPLPSIGHEFADQKIRRVALEFPGIGAYPLEDIKWALSQVRLQEQQLTLSIAQDQGMLRHYGVDKRGSRFWQTVTPILVPPSAARRRIDPNKDTFSERKDYRERSEEESRATEAIALSLSRVIDAEHIQRIEVRREPFDGRGLRAEPFAQQAPFHKERLWHARIQCSSRLQGPLLLGEARSHGLGLLRPIRENPAQYLFSVDGPKTRIEASLITHAFRRAVLALSANDKGSISPMISGHGESGEKTGRETARFHLSYDPARQRFLVFIQHAHRHASDLKVPPELERAMSNLRELYLPGGKRWSLRLQLIDCVTDPIFGRGRHWVSLTPYRLNRHRNVGSAEKAVMLDVQASLRAQGFPTPRRIEVTKILAKSNRGVGARVRIEFEGAVQGPFALGRDSLKDGGGLFEVDRERERGDGGSDG